MLVGAPGKVDEEMESPLSPSPRVGGAAAAPDVLVWTIMSRSASCYLPILASMQSWCQRLNRKYHDRYGGTSALSVCCQIPSTEGGEGG
ncbi:hypothetical protein PspLS_02612 [Pyricularia sp. CBS 133598]|nr:hypothetical protein PspLS_02612 [Pyricularia sp. CBS 133598]